jgi:23S rRNA (adenine2030-N6)-methyltransferase
MNYRHAYHAGNFADVLKHVVLLRCLDHLKAKDKPFRVIDTHAGAGRYRLDGAQAGKTGEWQAGVGRFMGETTEPLPARAAALLAPYLDALAAANDGGALKTYPGSPLLIQAALRAGDVLVANELHPEDAAELRASLGRDKAVKVSEMDGYGALKALLPPKERRGLVLIDPPFEAPGEFVRMTEALGEALARFATGIYVLWYPIKDEKPVVRFHRGISEACAQAGVPAPLIVELLLRPARNPLLLNGCGLAIVNPPFRLTEDLAALLPLLAARLGEDGKGQSRISQGAATTPTTKGTIRNRR